MILYIQYTICVCIQISLYANYLLMINNNKIKNNNKHDSNVLNTMSMLHNIEIDVLWIGIGVLY